MAQVVEQLTAVIGADITGLMAGLNAAKGALAGFAALGAATLGFGAAVKTAGEFDKNLKNIQATANLSNAQMDTMNKQLLEMGKNSTYGPNRVAEAMYDVVGGVQDSSKWMAILEQSLATAEAGQADLKATTQGLIFIMNSYNLAAKDATMVSDVFTRTVGVGVGTMDQFVAAMSPIAITAKTLKVDFKDLGAMTAFLTTKGNSASESATQLQSVMSALLKPTKEMKAALKALGFSSGSAMLKSLGFMGTLKALRKHVGGNTDSLAKMFGRVEGFKGVLSLTNGEFDKFSKNFKSGLTGATAKAQAIQLKSFDAQLKKLQASLETLAIKVGQVLLPPLTEFVTKITDGVNALSQMNPQLIPIIAGVLAIGTGIALLLPVITALGAVVGVLLGPVGAVIAAVGALVLAWQNDFLGIRTTLQPIVDAVRGAFEQIVMYIQGFFSNSNLDLKTRFELLFEGIRAAVVGLGSKIAAWFRATFPEVSKALTDFNTNIIQPTISIIKDLWTVVEPYLNQFKKWFTGDGLPQVSGALLLFNLAVVQPVIKTLSNFWNSIGPGFRLFAMWIHANLPVIKLAFDLTIGAMIQKINELLATIQKIIKKFDEFKAAAQIAMNAASAATGVQINPGGKPGVAVNGPAGDLLGNLLKGMFGGKRAGGGSVSRSGAYMVGERGPELFTPNRSGTIIPAGAMAGGYTGPSSIEVVLRAEDFEKRIYVNVAGAIRNAR